MAAVTIGRRIPGGVVAADVAVGARIHHRPDRTCDCGARRKHMRPLQREAGRRVVKLSVRPQHRIMACRTHRGRETCGNVIGNTPAKRRCALPGRLMTPIAIRVRCSEIVVVAHMAIRAGDHFSCWC